MKILFPIYVLLMTGIIGCTSSSKVQKKAQEKVYTNNPTFDWFKYAGHDNVFSKYETGDDEYQNPILAGFHPDPSITRAGDDYYLVNSSFAYFPGVPIFHSKDLVHWQQIGHVIDRPSQLNYDGIDISEGIFAPTIRYHDGRFYMITTFVGSKGGNFIVIAKDPAGPWSDPIWLPDVHGIDPSLFFDDNGKVYITYNSTPPGSPKYQGHRAIWMQEYDPGKKKTVGERTLLVNGGTDISKKPIWIEGPHIFKIDSTYYLFDAQGGTSYNHSEVVFKSDSAQGPYQPYEDNPILTQRQFSPSRPDPITSTGHADFVQLPNGKWWAVFLGCRPYKSHYYNIGRETFMLPVHWRDGWPVILEGDKSVPYTHKRPDLAGQIENVRPTTGNFTIRDDFKEQNLPFYWNFIRTSQEKWYDLDSGSLTINARPVTIQSTEKQPSFIGRRQQHSDATASTLMKYQPQKEGDKAGITAFQNSNFDYLLDVAMENGKKVIQLEKRADKHSEIIASDMLSKNFDGNIYLKIKADGGNYSFYYGYQQDDWKSLKENADGTILSTSTAGGFVGTYVGMFAFSK